MHISREKAQREKHADPPSPIYQYAFMARSTQTPGIWCRWQCIFLHSRVVAWCKRYHDNNQQARGNIANVLFEVLGLDSKSL